MLCRYSSNADTRSVNCSVHVPPGRLEAHHHLRRATATKRSRKSRKSTLVNSMRSHPRRAQLLRLFSDGSESGDPARRSASHGVVPARRPVRKRRRRGLRWISGGGLHRDPRPVPDPGQARSRGDDRSPPRGDGAWNRRKPVRRAGHLRETGETVGGSFCACRPVRLAVRSASLRNAERRFAPDVPPTPAPTARGAPVGVDPAIWRKATPARSFDLYGEDSPTTAISGAP